MTPTDDTQKKAILAFRQIRENTMKSSKNWTLASINKEIKAIRKKIRNMTYAALAMQAL